MPQVAEVVVASAPIWPATLDEISVHFDDDVIAVYERLNTTGTAFDLDQTVDDLFRRRAREQPGALGVVDHNHGLTYQQLDEVVDRISANLRSEGVSPGAVVALVADRSPLFVAAVLGIMRAGGAYLPIDPKQPADRREQILASADVRWVISDSTEGDSSGVRTGTCRVLPLGDLASVEPPPAPRGQPAGPDDLAYVIFTSGSTGTPKGAMVHHRALLNHLMFKVADLELTRDDRIAQNSPQSFDISVWQMLAGLIVEAEVVVIGDDLALEPAALAHEVQRRGITILEAVPSMAKMVLAALPPADGSPPAGTLGALRCLLVGGEEVPPVLVRDWVSRFPELPLVNVYGPTECADDVSHYWMRSAPEHGVAHLPIGTPISNVTLWVLAEEPCGARKVCRRRSSSVLVFVDEAIASGGSEHRDALWRGVRRLGLWCRGSLFERLVGSMLVVVSDVVADEAFELAAVPDDGAVEDFSADRSDPAFGERVRDRGPDGRLEDLEAFGAEDLVERVDELAAAIADQSMSSLEAFVVADEQIAGALRGPCAGGVGGDPGEDHLPGVHLDEEQDVVAAQERGVHGEEVARDRGLGVQELSPGHVGAVRRRVDAFVGEDLPDGCLGDLVAETGEFALYAAVPPGRVLRGESHDQLAQFDGGRWSSRASSWCLGPVVGDAFAVPAKQRFGCHDPALPPCSGKGRGDGVEQGPVVVVDSWSAVSASKHGVLVTEHDDLKILGASRTNSEPCQGGQHAVEDSKHEGQDGGIGPGQQPRATLRAAHAQMNRSGRSRVSSGT